MGEKEIEECKKSVQSQTYGNITHEVFSYLPNKEAHDTLYSRFMELQGEFDYFIKLDADMVFKRVDVVERIVNYLEDNRQIDQLSLSVYDFYTDKPIPAIHIFSKNCEWKLTSENLFVDNNPQVKYERKFIWYKSVFESPVLHSFNPYLRHAYIYGYHKAKKAFQRGEHKFDANMSIYHWHNINEIITNYHKTNSHVLGLAGIGAFDYLYGSGEVIHNNYKSMKLFSIRANKTKKKAFLGSRCYREYLRVKKLGLGRMIKINKVLTIQKIKTFIRTKKNYKIPSILVFKDENRANKNDKKSSK